MAYTSPVTYDLKSLDAPRAAGNVLRALVGALESPGAGHALTQKILADSGFVAFRGIPVTGGPDANAPVFDHGRPRAAPDHRADYAALHDALAAELNGARAGFHMETVADFAAAYRGGDTTPVEVAERTLALIAASERRDPPMRVMIAHKRDDVMAQAEASAARHAQGEPLGPLDGVPVAVKDEVDQVPYPTTVGTRFLGTSPAAADAEVVLRLRRAGALLFGKTNMHEIGIGVTGLNPHHGAVRNPYDPARFTGGSSSGSAAAVGIGLCPIAVSADGGGSIRMPAALCGQVGLKPTYGRVSEHGAAELCWSVGHLGPIAGSVCDCAVGYAVMCGPDDKDGNSLLQPKPELDGIARTDLSGVRLGVYRPWFEDAESDVVARCSEALEALRDAGATIVDVTINGLEVARVAHAITIVSEMATAHDRYYADHQRDYAHDTRINLALGRRMTASDYLHAQRHRARVYRRFASLLEDVDAIVTPTCAVTAKPIREDALRFGESDLSLLSQIMRYATPANLTGLPAISVPAGYDVEGMPVGLHFMGRAWEEHNLLRLAAVIERSVERRKPRVWQGYFG
jgi:Asp-tRNA(Asn)/Glu-tRNA(Gln) amidotransferase A subunit family amidase